MDTHSALGWGRNRMAKIGILVPREKMRQEVLTLLKEISLEVVYCNTIETPDTINEARRAVEQGAQLIVARGYQAKILREQTNIPLVEIHFTAQEICLLLQRAKEILGKPHPHVAIIAFENMLPDMTHIASLMDVELTVSYLEKAELVSGVLEEYEKNRPDIVIGGQITCEAARERGYLTLFYQSTSESIAEALRMARRISFAMDSEQLHTARFETVLDSSFHAILQVNAEYTVISINRTAEEMLRCKEREVIGKQVFDVLQDMNPEPLRQVLAGKRESLVISHEIYKEAFMVLIASIRFNERITGAILSFRQLSAVSGLSRQARRELLLRGFRTDVTFRDLSTKDVKMREILEKAEVFALSGSPVLLYEAEGNEASMIARAIHNNSDRKAGPFVSLDIRDLAPGEQVDALLYRKAPKAADPRRLHEEDTSRTGRNADRGLAASGAASASGNYRYAGHGDSLQQRSSGPHSRPGDMPDPSEDRTEALPLPGAMVRANHGTLFINRIEKLSLQAQHQLLRTLLPWTQMHTDARPIDSLDVRIIACAKQNLLPAVENDTFSEELYYHFSGLTLSIPPLESRLEDLKEAFRKRFATYTSRYNRPLQLTGEALRLIPQLRWPGGFSQVDAFCERLVLEAVKRRIDEQVIRELFNQLYPEVRQVQGEQRLVVYDAPQAQQIRDLLEKHRGDRTAVAEELGISKTTLWRHMKKYNVTAKY